jgi:hypothetical protein
VTVRLDKESVVRLYCYCREAERSVHRALSDPWPEFRAYYGPAKTVPIHGLLENLATAVRAGGSCPDVSEREEGFGIARWRFFLRYWFGRWLVRWEEGWFFPRREVCYMLGRLEALFRLLDAPTKPDAATLIALRKAFCECERIIEGRCYGLCEIEFARGIDHFNKTAWLPHVTLTDVLKKSA